MEKNKRKMYKQEIHVRNKNIRDRELHAVAIAQFFQEFSRNRWVDPFFFFLCVCFSFSPFIFTVEIKASRGSNKDPLLLQEQLGQQNIFGSSRPWPSLSIISPFPSVKRYPVQCHSQVYHQTETSGRGIRAKRDLPDVVVSSRRVVLFITNILSAAAAAAGRNGCPAGPRTTNNNRL